MNVVIDEFQKSCYTWGYGGKTIEDLIKTLGMLTIQYNSPVLVIDTRYHPNCSWDRNFCKSRLAKLIADQGCFYSHFREFGNPEKKTDLGYFIQRCKGFDFSQIEKHQVILLLGANRLYSECHREQIAQIIRYFSYNIIHLS